MFSSRSRASVCISNSTFVFVLGTQNIDSSVGAENAQMASQLVSQLTAVSPNCDL